jgi:CRISPR-associated protein Cmr1
MPKLGTAPTFQIAPNPSFAGLQVALKIVTPVLGGGVEAGMNDSLAPIRSSAVRGMLRWWWRATAGAACQSGPGLYDRECKIWGATDSRSKVSVEIHNPFLTSGVDAVRDEGGRRIPEQPPYALFPAQSDPIRKLHKSGSFELVISCPKEFLLEVENAIRAWIFFGGVGSRTRRGLGSLLAVSDPKFKIGAFAAFKQSLPLPQSRDWSSLSQSSFILGKKTNPVQAWTEAVNLYKDFRQDRPKRDQYAQVATLGKSRTPFAGSAAPQIHATALP